FDHLWRRRLDLLAGLGGDLDDRRFFCGTLGLWGGFWHDAITPRKSKGSLRVPDGMSLFGPLKSGSRGPGLGGKHHEAGARKVHDDFAGAGIMPANRDMLRRERDDFAAYIDLAVVIRHDLDFVTGLAAVGIVRVGQFGGLRRCRALRLSISRWSGHGRRFARVLPI